MTTPLQFTKGSFTCHLTLEMLDRALDAFVSNLDLERPALY